MKVLRQRGESTCGQTCVAMIAEVSEEKACKVLGHADATDTQDLIYLLRYFGIKNSGKRKRVGKKFPKYGIVWMSNKRKIQHWMVVWKDRLIDPEKQFASYYKRRGCKITSVLKVYDPT